MPAHKARRKKPGTVSLHKARRKKPGTVSRTSQRIHRVDALEKPCPGSPPGLGAGRFLGFAQVFGCGRRAGAGGLLLLLLLLLLLGLAVDAPDTVGVRTVVAHQVLAWIRDLRRDRMHPVERVEVARLFAGGAIARRAQLDPPVRLRVHLAKRDGRTHEVAAHAFRGAGVRRLQGLTRVHREAGMFPGKEPLHERLGQALGANQAQQEQAPEAGLDRRRGEALQRDEAPAALEKPSAHQGVDVRMPVAERAEGLNRGHDARECIAAVEPGLQAEPQGVVGRAAENGEQAAVALEEAAEGLGNREYHMTVRYRLAHHLQEVFREECRALGLAARTEVARLTGERDQVLGPAGLAAQAREACEVSPAVEELLYESRDPHSQSRIA